MQTGGATKVFPGDSLTAKDFYSMTMDRLQHLVSTNYDFSRIPSTSAGITPLMAAIANSSRTEEFSLFFVTNVSRAASVLRFTETNIDGVNALMMACVFEYPKVALAILELSNEDQVAQQLETRSEEGHSALDFAEKAGLQPVVEKIQVLMRKRGGKRKNDKRKRKMWRKSKRLSTRNSRRTKRRTRR